ncbi:MAG: c-type cytochrome, partial [Bacteroidota bacterium]
MKGSVLASRITLVLLLIASLVFNSTSASFAQPDGEGLFKAQCAQCHSTGDDRVLGPGLKDIDKRRTESWLIPWIKNSQAVIKSGDAYAVKIYNEYNQTAMPSFALTDDEIKAILAYVKTEGEKAPAAAPAGGVAGEAAAEEGFPW